jgi:hypothetical protein
VGSFDIQLCKENEEWTNARLNVQLREGTIDGDGEIHSLRNLEIKDISWSAAEMEFWRCLAEDALSAYLGAESWPL